MTIVANFSIEYTRFLDPRGEPTQSLPLFAEDEKKLIQLYHAMTLTRIFDTKAITLQRTGKMGTYASILGQEATSVGVGDAMKPEDVLCPFYRDYGAQFIRGVKMSDILTYWGGDERGSCFENAREDFPICVPIGTQILHAAGVAAAFKIRKEPRVAVTSFGDGGTSEGDFYEAINVAGAWNLPVVFVIHNNRWAISVPLSMQTKAETLAQKAIAAGFKGEQVDGNDVIAVRYVMERALEKARTGGGPTLIEALTYRLGDHTTVDDATRYRSKEEVQQAWIEEPLARLRKYLTVHHGWTEKDEEKLIVECAAEVDKAVQEYLGLKPQLATSMFDYHYAALPADLAEQRQEMLNHSSSVETH